MVDYFARIQKICNALPEVTEEYPWGAPHWKVAGKIFCGYGEAGGYRDEPSIGFRVTIERQEELCLDPRFAIAPYSGRYGGTTMSLGGKVDWKQVEAIIRESHRLMAPKKLVKEMNAASSKGSGSEPRASASVPSSTSAKSTPRAKKETAPMPRYYIVVGSPENFGITRDLGFTVHGLKARRRRVAEGLQAGDKVIFYLTGLQAWGGVVSVTGAAYEEHTPVWSGKKEGEDYPHRFPIKADVILGPENALPVEPMVPDIEYLKKWPAQHWRLGFQGNVHEIGEGDYKLIRKAIEARAKKPSKPEPRASATGVVSAKKKAASAGSEPRVPALSKSEGSASRPSATKTAPAKKAAAKAPAKKAPAKKSTTKKTTAKK